MNQPVHKTPRILHLALACLAGACVDPGTEHESDTTGDPSYEPVLEDADCGYPLPPEAAVRCAYLSVPEDRSRPEGPWVQLHVAIFASTADTPSAEPLFILNGGPGSSSLPAFALLLSPVGDLLRARQEVVYMDQRGTNSSVPALYCPQTLDVDPLSTYAEYVAANQELYATCEADLRGEGIDLSSYDTLQNARDFEDLRLALGAERVDLLGVSYGTRLAMTIMREFPDTIRSAVLDSPLPPTINPFHEGTRSLRSALDGFFARNPGAETDFDQVTASLRAEPRVVTTDAGEAHVDDLTFVNFVRSALSSSPPDLALAAAISDAAAGQLEAVAADWIAFTDTSSPIGPGTDASAEGLFYSVFCAEDGAATTMAEALAADDEFPEPNVSVRELARAYQLDYLLEPCADWDVDPIDEADYFDALDSDIPAVVLAGALDPQTPPYFAEATGAQLSQAPVLQVETGHVVLATQCGAQLAAAFLAEPSATPDAACATPLPPTP